MTRTPTLPPTDPTMQRKLKALAHPDNRGDHELFIWTVNLIEAACYGSQSEPKFEHPSSPPRSAKASDPDRVPFRGGARGDFATLTRRAMVIADEAPEPYGSVLRLLRNCAPLHGFEEKQERGASYKQLAAVGHKVNMTKKERVQWYRIAESVPLSDRHVGHILGRLQGCAA